MPQRIAQSQQKVCYRGWKLVRNRVVVGARRMAWELGHDIECSKIDALKGGTGWGWGWAEGEVENGI